MLLLTASSIALAVALSGTALSPIPVYPTEGPDLPRVGSETWIVYDETTDVVLASWNADERRPMASVTKVMTAMVVLDNASLTETVTVPSSAIQARGSTAGLVAGEEMTVNDLLVAMMIRSGNDAALTLAWHVGGSVDGFVAMMNDEAARLGLDDTQFMNPNGLDQEGHYSTARDLMGLSAASLEYPDIQRIARIRLVKLPEDPTGKTREYENTNRLLGAYPGVVGLKTGDTPWAGKVLLSIAERGPRRLIVVVMGADDHFADARELIDWGFRTYGIRDRMLRPFFGEQGGGGSPALVELDLAASHERRLAAMPKLDDGRWRMSTISELPKGEAIGEWLKGALPETLGGQD
jgi:D-alanyl-D-alanine carboxypeptidase